MGELSVNNVSSSRLSSSNALSYVKNPSNKNKVIIIGIFSVIVIIIILYFLVKWIMSLFKEEVQSEETIVDPGCSLIQQKEVFNIGNNLFSYDEARDVCKKCKGDLANLEQVIDAYKKGADWCNYGWIDGQMAVYPTQKETWEKLQKGPKARSKDCGLPGVNGGYFKNDKFLFGANCYAIKPKKEDDNEELKQYLVNHGRNNANNANNLSFDPDNFEVLPFSGQRWNE